VEPHRELKQISREQTFARDVSSREELRIILDELVVDLLPGLQSAPPARTLTLKLRYADWTTVTRRQTPGTIVTAEVLAPRALQLFEESWDTRPLRLMGLALSNFVADPAGQLSLFPPPIAGSTQVLTTDEEDLFGTGITWEAEHEE
jgi:DNA polymerase-4